MGRTRATATTQISVEMLFSTVPGCYFSGTCIGGILLVIDYLRKRIHSHSLTENELRREKGEEEGQ